MMANQGCQLIPVAFLPNQLGEVQQNMQPIQYAALPQMQFIRDGYAQMPMIYKPGQPSEQQRWAYNLVNLYLLIKWATNKKKRRRAEEKKKKRRWEEEEKNNNSKISKDP